MNIPIQRQECLKSLSHDHHHGLVHCRRIRIGLEMAIDPVRIMNYCHWFYHNHLSVHFEIEEKFVFPVLGNDHKLVKKALIDHRRIKRLLTKQDDLLKVLNILEETLENHIRFEERILFQEVEHLVTVEQGKRIIEANGKERLAVLKEGEWRDKFW